MSQQTTVSKGEKSIHLASTSLSSSGNSSSQEFKKINLFIKAHNGKESSLIQCAAWCNFIWTDQNTTNPTINRISNSPLFQLLNFESPRSLFWHFYQPYFKHFYSKLKCCWSPVLLSKMAAIQIYGAKKKKKCSSRISGRFNTQQSAEALVEEENQLADLTTAFPRVSHSLDKNKPKSISNARSYL